MAYIRVRLDQMQRQVDELRTEAEQLRWYGDEIHQRIVKLRALSLPEQIELQLRRVQRDTEREALQALLLARNLERMIRLFRSCERNVSDLPAQAGRLTHASPGVQKLAGVFGADWAMRFQTLPLNTEEEAGQLVQPRTAGMLSGSALDGLQITRS